jgi:hypothetical protein
MACDLTAGRLWECKEQVGGIKTVYFADFGDLTGLTVTNGAIATGLNRQNSLQIRTTRLYRKLNRNINSIS